MADKNKVINKDCKYIKIKESYEDLYDDLYTNPRVSWFCEEKKEYIITCPISCLWKTHADAGGHYQGDTCMEICNFCGSTDVYKFKRSIIENVNINKILLPEDLEELYLCKEHLLSCKKTVKEIIGFKVDFGSVQDFIDWMYGGVGND